MKKTILLVVCANILLGCNKNDDSTSPENESQNNPPLSFNLLEVPDGATEIGVTPTLSWESAENPEGSEVTYDLYLGTEENPSNLYQSDISETSFPIEERLNLISDYYWKVVAKDAEEQTSQSSINSFTTRNINIPSEPLNFDTGFDARIRHSTTVFDDKLWVIAGSSGGGVNNVRNDVWYSSDGLEWKQATAEGEFPKRNIHSAVAFDDKLWIIGGYDDSDYANDVWYSENGIEWIEAVKEAPFSPRYSHTATVFNNKIWVIGGNSESGRNNDVWYSENGFDWLQATENAPFEERSGHGAVVFENKLWLMGGALEGLFNAANDVWQSADGIVWTEVTTTSPPSSFYGRNLVVFDDSLWVLGGTLSGTRGKPWYSKDGMAWEKVHEQEPLLNRHSFSVSVFKDKIWLIGGQDNAVHQNDVWVLE